MSYLLDSYRKNAEAAEVEAQTSSLPNVAERAARVAEKWTELAQALERVEANKR